MSWFDDNNKKLLSGAKALGQNYLKKNKKKITNVKSFNYNAIVTNIMLRYVSIQ